MELEAIRSRTREALRSRVRDGRVAGGACFGYTLNRHKDASGRGYTLATVNEPEAEVVRRIYSMYRGNHGLKAIAKRLNSEGVPSPSAGRRGSGSVGAWFDTIDPLERALPRHLHPRTHQEGSTWRRIGSCEGRASRNPRDRSPRVAHR